MTFWGDPRALDRNNSLTGKPRMRARTACLALALGVALVIGGSPAEAAISPPGCNTSGANLNLQQNVSGTVTIGQTVTYTLALSNGASPSCDVLDVVAKGFCPDASGNPTILAISVPVGTLLAPTLPFIVGTFPCVITGGHIDLLSGVLVAQAANSLTGNLQDSVGVDPLTQTKTLSVNIAAPPPPPPPPPPENPIPTLSEWVMIMLAVFLALAAGAALRRKRIA